MKFGIFRVSGDYPLRKAKEEQWFNPYLNGYEAFYTIEIETLEELLKIKNVCGSRVIIDNIDSWEKKYIEAGCKAKIIIYDNWLE